MKKIFLAILIVISVLLFVNPLKQLVYSDELDDLNKEIADLQLALDASKNATAPLESQLNNIKAQLEKIDNQIAAINADIEQKREDIDKGYVELADQKDIFDKTVRNFYIKSYAISPLNILLSSGNPADFIKAFVYQKRDAEQDKNEITNIALKLLDLEKRREKLEDEELRLAVAQAAIDIDRAEIEEIVLGAKAYQADLTSQIATLTARQQSILSEKSGTFQTSVGDVPVPHDYNSSPAFSPGFSPAFAAFSFGAPHFKGMSQYGAFGRAKSGQNMETILQAYYGNVRIETVDTNFSLPTVVGNLPFEDNYLKGIAEMPTSWADKGGYEALKAQAIAARSYGLAYTNWRMGSRQTTKPICIDEGCQVYNSGKADNPGRWGDAVNDTRGKIMVSNDSNEVVNAWYASTSGGYQDSYSSLGHTTPGFWDTSNGRDGWTNQAYEKIGDSPWFYKGWYKSRSGDNCGRSHPWLNSEEMADILNGWVVLFQGGGDSARVTPQGPCWGDNPYSVDELRSIGGYISVSNVSITYANNGVTANVTFNTNKGTVAIKGNDFYKAFNLRAPGRVSLKSGLYNIETK